MQFLTGDFIFDGYKFLSHLAVLVVDSNGRIVNILSESPNENVQHYSGCLIPGFVNAHCHLELSHLKNIISEKTGLVDFLLAVNAKRNSVSEAEKLESIEKAELEMLNEGIVAIGDISNGLDSFSQKQKGNLKYHTFVECVGLLDDNARERFEFSKTIFEKFNTIHASSIVLHAPYSVSDSLIKLVNETQAKISSIHNQESEQENKLFLTGKGDFLKLFESILGNDTFYKLSSKNSIQTYLPKLNKSKKLILVHNTFTSKDDIEFAKALHKNLILCVCPSANLYIENRLPDLEIWQNAKLPIVIGTDSLASNTRLSILNEIQILQKHFINIPLSEMLIWATINGAKALNMDNELGSFEVGKKPGILQIENMIDGNSLPELPILTRLF
jgi:aminodeoxyfutalosine deaminase